MTDRSDFETHLEQRLRTRAALASRPFDAAAIAHDVMGSGASRPRVRWPAWPSMRPGLVALVIVLLLAIALLGIAVVGSWNVRLVSPAIPRANGWIAVSANPMSVGGGEAGDIYRVEAGAAARRIIGSDADGVAQACPRFSPDGRRLAYGEARASDQPVTTFRGNWPVADRAVVVVGLDARGEVSAPIIRKLVSPESGQIVCPEWSPDGRSIAVVVGAELQVIDPASGATAVVPLTTVTSGTPEFAWSRDASRIAVAQSGQIRVVRVADRTWEIIGVGDVTPESLGWSADDRQIVYVATVGSRGESRVVRVLDMASRSDIQMTVAADPEQRAVPDSSHAQVSPDGTRVAYIGVVGHCTAGACTSDPPHVVTMDLDGAHLVDVAPASDIQISGIQWSPAGDSLLLSSIDGLVSVGTVSGSPGITHSSGELNLEWSWDEVTWQPVFK